MRGRRHENDTRPLLHWARRRPSLPHCSKLDVDAFCFELHFYKRGAKLTPVLPAAGSTTPDNSYYYITRGKKNDKVIKTDQAWNQLKKLMDECIKERESTWWMKIMH